jgi:uridine kinase
MSSKFSVFSISGGTASGKTTLARDLCACAIEFGLSSSCISLDNFYKRFDMPLEERRLINFDHPDSFDIDLLISCLSELCQSGKTAMPVYDFTIHNRTESLIELSKPHLLIVEGILTLHFSELRELYSYNIFVDTSNSLRLERKLIRDVSERKRTKEYALNQWHTYSQPMFEKYCLPSSKHADLVFSGECWTQDDVKKILLDYYSIYKYC